MAPNWTAAHSPSTSHAHVKNDLAAAAAVAVGLAVNTVAVAVAAVAIAAINQTVGILGGAGNGAAFFVSSRRFFTPNSPASGCSGSNAFSIPEQPPTGRRD